MKKILLIVTALLMSALTYAQQQLATLNHNDSISVYYGATALQQAHAAAVNGDIITLSPGAFNSVNIGKAVTIRGAGMYPDSAAGTLPTILVGEFGVSLGGRDTIDHLCLEGINLSGSYWMEIFSAISPTFTKCYFNQVRGGSAPQPTNLRPSFYNCIIKGATHWGCQSATFVNCVIAGETPTSQSPSFINCIVKAPYYLENISIVNSIIYGNRSQLHGYGAYYCIGVNQALSDIFHSDETTTHNLHNYSGLESIFKTFRGDIESCLDFQLQDSIATSILGNDGTQLGIYGGVMPFDPSVRNPLIRRCNVANRTTADGKLSVDIEVVSE